MYLYTVIIPHYNSPHSLLKLINSIPCEDFIQLIVVDDKSTLDTSNIEHIVLKRGGLFIHNNTERKGAGTARNLGLSEARGKWLIFADADDYFLNDAFDILNTHADSDADIIYFAPISRYINTEIIASRHLLCEKWVMEYIENQNENTEMTLRYKFITPWSKMIRRQLVVEKQIFFDEVPVANDTMFSTKSAFYANTIDASMEQIYCVTQSEHSLTGLKNEKNYWCRVEVFAKRQQFIQEKFGFSNYPVWAPLGIHFLINALKQGYNIKFVYKIYQYFKKENVIIFSWRRFLYCIWRKKK